MQDYKFNHYKPSEQTIEEIIKMQLLLKNLDASSLISAKVRLQFP